MSSSKQALKAVIEMADTRARLLEIKQDIQELFLEVFERPFTDKEWEHFYLNNPAGQTISFFCYNGKELVAHGGIIPQQLFAHTKEIIPYFLQTGIMVRKKYQTLVLFKELMDAIHSYIEKKNTFVIAFPNDKTYLPFVKMLGWTCVKQFAIGHYEYNAGASFQESSDNNTEYLFEIHKTPEFLRWRGELNGLQEVKTREFDMEYKDYQGSFEILDLKVYQQGWRIPLSDMVRQRGYKTANIPECFLPFLSLKDMGSCGTVSIMQRMCFYPFSYNKCRYDRIRPTLLLSDVF